MSEQDEYARQFPLATKLSTPKNQFVLLQQFLSWLLDEKGLVFAKYADDMLNGDELDQVYVDPRALILEFCDIDREAYEAEIDKMIEQLRGRGA